MAVDAETMGRRIAEYREALANATRPVGAFKNDNVAVFMMAYCAETREEARAIAEESFNWYLEETLRHFLGWAGGGDMPQGYEWYVQAATHTAKLANARNFDYLLEGGMILCGTPDDLVQQIRRFEEVGATQMLMGISIGDITHEEVLRSIDMIGQEVIPQFQRSPSRAAIAG
jgi:alkanesulfonate monooxygenase SsuD/methylene tetrahydromethanopterin reductase-like flavin-dependent oxidoreductase (luciferase family)